MDVISLFFEVGESAAKQARIYGFLDENKYLNWQMFVEFNTMRAERPEATVKELEEVIADKFFLSPDRVHRIISEQRRLHGMSKADKNG